MTTASPIALPASSNPILSFQSWEEKEASSGFDTRKVFISTNGVTFSEIFNSTNNDASWYQAQIDLSAYAGQNIWLRFEFNTGDAANNNLTGWFIDDVRVGEALPAIANTASIATNEGVSASDTINTPVFQPLELTVTKTANPDPAVLGGELTYTLTVVNNTPANLTGVVLTDMVPPNTTYVPGSASDGGNEAGGVVQWDLGMLGPGASEIRTFKVVVDSLPTDFFDDLEGGGGNWTTTGLWHLEDDGDACGNSFSPTTSFYYGQSPPCNYNTGFANSGQLTTASPIALPASSNPILSFQSWEEKEGNPNFDTRQVFISTNGVNFNQIFQSTNNDADWYQVQIDLSAYAGQNIWLRFEFNTGDSAANGFTGWYIDDVHVSGLANIIINTASVTTDQGDSASDKIETPVVEAPFLTLTKTVDDSFPRLNQILGYTITVTNSGTIDAIGGVISDTQPVGLTFGSVTLEPSGAGTFPVSQPNLVTDLGILGNTTVTATFTATVNISDVVITNTAEVTAPNAPIESADQVSVTVGRQPCPILGMDGFGYSCLDSIDPGGPVFAFEDISTSGAIILNNNDEGEANVSLPFPFTYYDVTATDLTVGMNGAIIFGQTGQNIDFNNLALDDGATPDYMIAPFWDNLDDLLDISAFSQVRTQTLGTAPNRRFIIQWNNIPHFDDIGNATFQVILYEGGNEILFQYQDVDFGNAAFDDGAEASVGIRGNSTGNSLPYSFDEHLIKDGLAIRFIPPLVNLALTKTVDDDQPRLGQTITYTITVENVAPGMNVNDGIISDTMPAGLTFVGPVTFDPPGSGTPGILPQLATNLTITNGQSVTLTFPVSINTADTVITNTAEVSASNAVITATDQAPIVVGRQPCPAISPDTFGYTCLDSNDPGGPIFAFEDISGTGDQFFFADNNNGEANIFAMPFDFTYYDITANALTVGMNGAIIFGQTGQDISLANLALDSPATQNYMIAPFWDNLDNDPGVGGGVFFETRGTAPNRRFIIQWQDIPHTNDVGTATFQLILFEGSNEILFQYQDVDFGNTGLDEGNSASVGIRGNGISNALPYARNEVLIKSGLAIRFFPPATNLIITKTALPTTVTPGDSITYTITFSNQGADGATGVVITDHIPAVLTNVNVVNSGVAITDTGAIPAFVWEVQDLQPGQGGTITITAQIDPLLTSGGLFTNTATINTASVESDTLNNTDEAGVTIDVEADLVVTKTASPTIVEPSDPITYTITFSNQGVNVATGVVITDQLPVTLTNVNVVSSGVAITDTGSMPAFVWEIQDLQPGQGGTITITALINPLAASGSSFTNTAIISTTSVESDTLNNEAEAGVTIIVPDLTIAKTVFPTTVALGNPITFTLTFSNQGTSLATNISIFDTLPVTLTNIVVVSSGVAITDTGGTPFTWEIQDLQPGQGGTITITGLIDNLTSTGLYTNTAVIFTLGVDSDPNNDTAEAEFTVTASDLVLTKAVDEVNPNAGEVITYTITVQNVGTADATGAVVSDTLPLSLTLAGPVTLDPPSAGTSGAPPLLATNVIISAGQSITITFPVTVSAMLSPGTVITNTAAVTSLVVTTSQTDSVTITVGDSGGGSNVYLPLIIKDQ